mgnify:CR=1 FL=1
MINFQSLNQAINIEQTSKGVESVEIKLVLKDGREGQVNVTDIMLQGGSISTNWSYHPSELRWSHDG